MGQWWTKTLYLVHSCRRGTNDDTMRELAGGKVRLVTTMKKWEEETSQANKEGKIVLVNFSASWCSSCTQFAPAYRKLANKYTPILFLTVDVDKLAEFSSTWDINATPTFFFLREGRQLDKCIGANKDELVKKIIAITESSASSSLS